MPQWISHSKGRAEQLSKFHLTDHNIPVCSWSIPSDQQVSFLLLFFKNSFQKYSVLYKQIMNCNSCI